MRLLAKKQHYRPGTSKRSSQYFLKKLSAASRLATSWSSSVRLVFSDVVMPGMSGTELGREIQLLYPDLPVVLGSGYSDAIVQSGARGFPLLSEPYAITSLS